MKDYPQMHSKLVDKVFNLFDGTEYRRYLRLVPVIVYREEILHLCQNMISVLFMVEMCDVIRPGT